MAPKRGQSAGSRAQETSPDSWCSARAFSLVLPRISSTIGSGIRLSEGAKLITTSFGDGADVDQKRGTDRESPCTHPAGYFYSADDRLALSPA